MKAGTVLGGRYCLEQPIGEGGMGEVWAARDSLLDCVVAVKLANRIADTGALTVRRFEREARCLARLRSPHVVHAYDYGAEPVPHLVMELLHGETLRSRLSRSGRLTLLETSKLATGLALALDLAHSHGIVHRDVKPGNVFLARYGELEVVKLIDFGIARFSDTSPEECLTSEGVVLGSMPYLSPEQARGESVDFRSDLWSFAVVIFRALAGTDPFPEGATGEVEACPRGVPDAWRLLPELPQEVVAFFQRAFSHAPGARHASAGELAAALRAIASSETSARSLVPSAPAPARSEEGNERRSLVTASWKAPRAPVRPRRVARHGRTLAGALSVALAGALAFVSYRVLQVSAAPPPAERRSPDVPAIAPQQATTLVSLAEPAPLPSAENDRPPAEPPVPLEGPARRRKRTEPALAGARELDPVFGLRSTLRLEQPHATSRSHPLGRPPDGHGMSGMEPAGERSSGGGSSAPR